MRRTRIIVTAGVAAALAVAGSAGAVVLKGSGKFSVSIIGITSPGHGNNSIDAKPMGTVSSKPLAAKVGVAPTGGAIFTAKVAKPTVPPDPAKPGFADGQYVLEVESAPTPDSAIVGNPAAAAFYIRFDVTGGKCTVHTNPHFKTGGDMCGGTGQPLCAVDAVGKCSATIYQVAGEALANPGGQLPGDPFYARFRIRTAPASNCETGDVCLNGSGGICNPLTTQCFANPVIAVSGVALAPFGF
jgi:hypothetical protein